MVLLFGGAVLGGWYLAGRPGLRDKTEPQRSNPGPVSKARVETPTDAEMLFSKGKRREALRALHELRRQRPGDAEVSFTMGRLYFIQGWQSEGIAAYREAVHKDGSYGSRSEMIDDLVQALRNPEAGDKARALLNQIGRRARPRLAQLARRHPDATVREDAASLLEQLRGPTPLRARR
jgi:hypothetical protein